MRDRNYKEIVENAIKRVAKQYAEDVYREDFLENASPETLQEVHYTIDKQLLFETLLFEIRGDTIKYSAEQKRNKNAERKLILHNLEEAEKESDKDPSNEAKRDRLDDCKQTANDFERKEAEGAATRARADWKLNGEKPTKFFCALEKHNNLQKYIPRLDIEVRKENGTTEKKIITCLLYTSPSPRDS